ncbi:MAG: hypothetical protein COX20_03055 [Desulfobacterales bacterium CG23_combo_of_CG06-09_8_20_14_all_52_9]|nr:MAG: hypothetical protein COX20_03055 [Desulfobacterales bacterium CG23_combo_of_CG06-09_8_20_14_all_52_9]
MNIACFLLFSLIFSFFLFFVAEELEIFVSNQAPLEGLIRTIAGSSQNCNLFFPLEVQGGKTSSPLTSEHGLVYVRDVVCRLRTVSDCLGITFSARQ